MHKTMRCRHSTTQIAGVCPACRWGSLHLCNKACSWHPFVAFWLQVLLPVLSLSLPQSHSTDVAAENYVSLCCQVTQTLAQTQAAGSISQPPLMAASAEAALVTIQAAACLHTRSANNSSRALSQEHQAPADSTGALLMPCNQRL